MISIAESVKVTAPKISAKSAYMGQIVTITMDNPSNVTHDLSYQFQGGALHSIASGIGASYDWRIPDLGADIPNSVSGVLTIRCTTKYEQRTIGTQTVAMTAKVPNSALPTIKSVTVRAENGDGGNPNIFVQGESKLSVSIVASGASGSTIKSYGSIFNKFRYSGSRWTSDLIETDGVLPIVVTVEDSRGRPAIARTSINVLKYSPPRISVFTAYRCDENGAYKNDGEMLAVSYSYSIDSLMGQNTAKIELYYKESTDESYSEKIDIQNPSLSSSGTTIIQNPTFSPDYQFDLKLTVTDSVSGTASYEIGIPSGAVILDLASDGLGIAIGKTSERHGIEIAWEIYGLADQIREEGYSEDGWYYRKYRSGVAECWATGRFTNVDVTANHYSGFYYSDIIEIPLPFRFEEIISGHCDGGSNTVINFLRTNQISKTGYKFWVCGLYDAASNVDIVYRLHVIGRITPRPIPPSKTAVAGIAIAGVAVVGDTSV